MSILFIGDLQERPTVLPALEDRTEHLVFMGDIFDSYQFDSPAHVQALDTILAWVEQGKATLLMGNHEASYLWPRMRCSGFRAELAVAMTERRLRYLELVQPFKFWPEQRVLATHAGLNSYIWDKLGLSLASLSDELLAAYKDLDSWFFWIGGSRGGVYPTGGPLWCDWYDEFIPIEGLTQVVGHSRTRLKSMTRNFRQHSTGARGGMRKSDNGDWCIDALADAPEVMRWDPETDAWDIVTLACEETVFKNYHKKGRG